MVNKALYFILVVCTLLLCTGAKAQVAVEFKLLPPGALGIVDGVKYRLYTFDEWVLLARFDNELFVARANLKDQSTILEAVNTQLEEKDKQIATLEDDKRILAARGIRLDASLADCEERVIELAGGGSILPYIVGALGVLVGVSGVVYGVARD